MPTIRFQPALKSVFNTAIAAFCLSSPFANGATLSCPSSTTLESLIDCVSLQMPQDGSNGFAPPNVAQQTDIQTVVNKMLQGQCDFALPTSLDANMALRTFKDASNSRNYCVLMEVTSTVSAGYVDKGWGTFIVYLNAVREISHQAPHPKFNTSVTGKDGDAYSEREAIRIFKASDSRSYLMAGSRRSANHIRSTCQSSYWMSDVAHDIGNLFHPINLALSSFYGNNDWTAIQWHGKASSTCSNDVYISHGFSTAPASDSKVPRLQKPLQLAAPHWKIEIPGSSSCTLNGTTNVQGRYLNGVPAAQVCGTAATKSFDKFIHVEQTVGIMGSDLNGTAAYWAKAIDAAFPSSSIPASPSGLAATAGDRQVSLSWSSVARAGSYNVKRGSVATGPFSVIGNTAATSHLDNAVENDLTYYYTVAAVTMAGESADSNVVSAKPTKAFIPAAPANLQATPGRRKVTLRWEAAQGASSYTIKSSTSSNGPFETIAMGVTEPQYVHKGLSAKKIYYYVVHAVNSSGVSPASNMVSAKPLPRSSD